MATNPAIALQKQLDEERRLVSFDSYDMSIRQIYDMYIEKAIFVPPEYQRQFVWDPARESALIESIFLGIPVPSLFMATNPDSTWEIVDGVQRLSTLVHFIGATAPVLQAMNRKQPLEIEGLEKLSSLNSFTFETLAKSIQLMFMTRPIRVTVLNDKSDLNVRFDLFERLNTGGISLTNQEIRNCIYRGPFNEALKTLARSDIFKSVVLLKDSSHRNGMAEEYVLRFFAYLDEYENFDHNVKEFLNSYMRQHSPKALPATKAKLFKETFAVLAKAYPDGIARGQSSITAANLYEALTVGVALALRAKKAISIPKLKRLANDPELKKLTTGATNSNKMVRARINFVKDSF